MSQPSDKKELRSDLRINKNFSMVFHIKHSPNKESDESYIRNISKGGLRFTNSLFLEPGTHLVMGIKFPQIAPKRLTVEGEVVSCQETKLRLIYEIRVKFKSMDHATSQLFETIKEQMLKESKTYGSH